MILSQKSINISNTKIHEKQQMRIQEGHFLKTALNLDLTLPDDGECPAFLISCGIICLDAYCVELWSFFVSKRISVPMSYISFWEHISQIRANVGRVPLPKLGLILIHVPTLPKNRKTETPKTSR